MIRRAIMLVALAAAPALAQRGRPVPSTANQQQAPLPTTVAEARLAIATGRYAEGMAFLEKVAKSDTSWMEAQVELVRANTLLSRFDDAERVGRAAAAATGGHEALPALGELLRARGRLAAADSAFARAIALHASDSLMARLNLALDARQRGDVAGANRSFDTFIDVYNGAADRLTSREMMAVAIAVRELGPTNAELYKDAMKAFDRAITIDPANIDARVALGRLFLAKYNGQEAQRTLEDVLQVNPAHPGALVAGAERLVFDGQPGADSLLNVALGVSPEFVPARVMLAHGMVDVERYADAAREAERALRVNPVDPEALAALAGARFVMGDEKGYDEVRARAEAANPHDAGFYVELTELTARVRRYATAADFARKAVAADSLNWKAWSLLGMNLLRMGQVAEAKAALDRSFKGDPYDVWVKNTLDLLDTYRNYETTSSEHATFLIEKEESPILGVYLRDLAERAYATFKTRYQYTPPPIRIEVYRSHADFSVRAVGLAGLGALGVSFGSTLAFDSPAAKDAGPFNWASTVWHELAHTFTLGSTDHRVPRWFSEGLSVWEEHNARPGWGQGASAAFLEAYRTGKLVPVSRMNDGFMRPAMPEQVGLSYYQASLVCDLIVREWGGKGLVALLAEYKAGRTTDEAFQKVTGADMRAFDRRFDAYIRERFAGPLAALAVPGPEYPAGMTPAELLKKADETPGGYKAQVLAGMALMKIGDRPAAARVLERAHALFPMFGDEDDSPAALLVPLYLAAGDTAKAIAMLKVIASSDESAFKANVQLATLELSMRDTAGAVDALERAVWINPFPPEIHERLATIAERRGDHVRRVREREALVALDPVDKAEAQYQLARAFFDSGDVARAKRAVLRALEDAPNFERAQDLLLAIVDGRKP